jgi:hypothetical protein
VSKGIVFISYGMGGAAIETWSTGLRQLIARCKAIDLDTAGSPYHWSDVNTIVEAINRVPTNMPIGVGGSSLGDDEASDIASRTKRAIKQLFGFQDSSYGVNVGVPDNVEFADNIWNPSWLETFGLGSRKWWRIHPRPDDEKTGRLRNIPIHAPHPDDWGVAQDVIFSRLHARLLGDSMGAK